MGAFVAGYRFRDCDEIVVEGVRLYLEGDKGDKDEASTAGAKQTLAAKTVDMMSGKVMIRVRASEGLRVEVRCG
jgi:hypothetical protein